MDDKTRSAILDAASGPWVPIPPGVVGVDTNTVDVFTLAIGLEDHGVAYPTILPDKATGIAIVNEVETFVDAKLIRTLSPRVITERAIDLVSRLDRSAVLDASPLTQLAVAFCVWHGCINMAKSLRYETSDHTVYTEDVRTSDYEDLRKLWTDEDARGNPWIRYGVSLARDFEMGRGNTPIDDEVPKDSPYWT